MDNKKQVGARLHTARKNAGVSLQSLGEHLGISAQAVQQWEKGITLPSPSRLGVVAAFLQCNVGWLITGRGDKEHSENVYLVTVGGLGGRMVPRVDLSDALAFSKGDIEADHRVYTAFPCSELAFQVLLKDKSNVPEYGPGDAVVIDPSITPSPGDMVLAVVSGEKEAIFRRYRVTARLPATRIMFEPLSKDWPPIEVDDDQNVQILGVETEHTKRRR